MNDQIKDLPDFDKEEREVQRHLRKMDLVIFHLALTTIRMTKYSENPF
jgi:hypothetical protein